MKKILSLLFIFLFFYPVVSLAAEEPSLISNKELSDGIVSRNSHHSMATTNDGGFINIGTKVYPLPNGYPNKDIVLIKSDAEGNVEWEKHFGSYDTDEGFSVMVLPSDEYILLTSMYLNGNHQSVLIKTDSSGNVIWQKTIGGIFEGYNDINLTKDNGFILTGRGRGYAPDGLTYSGVALKKLD
ncbi:hypothetical protein [Neobacillus drentensis]|uniref:hypothetical protein n=1 Tax=Neobacillus drentensis TaxID=220684 RepID=UPI000825117D|nr:hypothetical protein [Neobacillus drentensis]